MAYNSTIIQKKKICVRCGKPCYWFSKKRCQDCSRIEGSLDRMETQTNREVEELGLSALIQEADEIYSKWLRMSAADPNGTVICYTCDQPFPWQNSQCGHYIKRGNLFLRWDTRNTRVQCQQCNIYKGGNYIEFTRRLENQNAGITDILMEEATTVYKPSRHEIKNLISEYSNKLRIIQNEGR